MRSSCVRRCIRVLTWPTPAVSRALGATIQQQASDIDASGASDTSGVFGKSGNGVYFNGSLNGTRNGTRSSGAGLGGNTGGAGGGGGGASGVRGGSAMGVTGQRAIGTAKDLQEYHLYVSV